METTEPMNFHPANPILRVSSLAASIEHYLNVLGFSLDWEHPAGVASVSRGRAHIMLCEGDQGNFGTWVWIGVGDAGRLHEEYKASGASIRLPPSNFPWALEMHVQDPDGHVLRFGSDPVPGAPPGDWLDMHGRWHRSVTT